MSERAPYVATFQFEIWEWEDAKAAAMVASLAAKFREVHVVGEHTSQYPGRLLTAQVQRCLGDRRLIGP